MLCVLCCQQGRMAMAVALSTCLVASAGIFVSRSGGVRSEMVQQSLMGQAPPGYIDPEAYLDNQAHTRFVRSTAEAEHMYANNVKVKVPCAWGNRCQMHVRPTLRERTDGAWLGDGPVTQLNTVSMASQRLAGPWAQKFAKDLPQPAGGGWGDVDRATHRGYASHAQHAVVTGGATKSYVQEPHYTHATLERVPPAVKAVSPVTGLTRQQLQHIKAEKREKENEMKLENKAAAIKAQMAKMLDSYSDAAIKTSAGYQP